MRRTRSWALSLAVIGAVLALGLPVSAAGSHAISIGDASATEGDAGTTVFMFTVSVSPAPDAGETITVNYATSDGSAQDGGPGEDTDYTAKSGSVPIVGPASTASVTVDVSGDTKLEGNETFAVTLSNPTSNQAPTTLTLSKPTGTGTIVNDDALPKVTLSPAPTTAQTEGNAGSTSLTFTATLDASSSQTTTVNYTTANGSATAPSDYTATNGTLSFVPGQTTRTFTVSIVGDSIFEPDESFDVQLQTPTNATLGMPSSSEVTISNDDTPGLPQIAISDTADDEGNVGFKTLTFDVWLSQAPAAGTVTVDFVTANGTASAPADYTPASGTLTFTPVDTKETIDVQILGDTTDEVDETFLVNLSNVVCNICGIPTPTFAGSDSQGSGTIVNDDGTAGEDPANQVSVDDASVTEGGSATFTVTRGSACPPNTSVVVPFDTHSFDTGQPTGTATDGVDHARAQGSLTIGAGESSKTFTVTTIQDTIDESDETFGVFLGAPTGSCTTTVGDGQGQGTIVDDDGTTPPPGSVVVDAGKRRLAERAGGRPCRVPVTLSRAATQTVTVKWATQDKTAQAGTHYVAASGTLTFVPGDTQEKAEVTALRSLGRRAAKFFVVLSDPTGGVTIGKDRGSCLIRPRR